MNTHVLVVDPGVSGGFVRRVLRRVYLERDPEFDVFPFVSIQDASQKLRDILGGIDRQRLHVVIERVHASPVMSQASAFSFGENYGAWLGLFAAYDLKVHGVSPQQWQMNLPIPAGVEGSGRKSALNRLCKQRHPGVSVTLRTCDAILLSDFVITHLNAAGSVPGKQL